MTVAVRSFAKINIGLEIGPRRADGFHALRTVYQTVALHDRLRVEVARGTGIEIRSKDQRVPCDESNTCWRMAERAMKALKARGRVVIQVEKALPVQGGLGGASSNAVATLLALERALGKQLAARGAPAPGGGGRAPTCRCFWSAARCWASDAARRSIPSKTSRRWIA